MNRMATIDAKTLSGFELALTEIINCVSCEFYKGDGFDGAITREKLGAALGYSNPGIAVGKIHRRHKERLDARSGVTSLVYPDGGTQETVVYSIEGALEVCRWSRSPVADTVMDSLYAVFKKLLTAGSVSLEDLPQILSDSVAQNPSFAYETIVPALQTPKLNQRELIEEITGINGNGTAIEKQLETNFIAAEILKIWEKEKKIVFSVDDLPEEMRNHAGAMHTIQKWSKSSKFIGVIVNYCGSIRFDEGGFRHILNYGVKNRLLSDNTAKEWLEAKVKS